MRVAFVVQRCGLEVNGGAELHCLQVAQRMARFWQTEILTTCALDYMTWENFYPEGVEQIGETVIRRFPVDMPRDIESFNRLSSELAARQDVTALSDQEGWMRAQGPISKTLFDYLLSHAQSYDAFIFFGYLYATTYFGLPLVAEKAFLAPLAHNEWPIYFSMWDCFFAKPRRFIFNTSAELDFLRRRFPKHDLIGPIAGVGIEAPLKVDPDAFRSRYNLAGPFLLFVGRIDESKGCAVMLDYFIRWKQRDGSAHKLVLIGRETMPVPFHDDIIYLGFVDDKEKWRAMKACDWLIVPSPYESLSMTLLETWSMGRPALVNGDCDVLVRHCQQANGGLWYKTFEEWCGALSIADDETKARLGRQGQTYVRQHYSWKRVEADYLALLGPLSK